MAAKKARGIEKQLPWSHLDRREKRVASDEDGEHEKEVCISRQRALLKAGASVASREAARGNAFGGSRIVQEAHESAARDVASGGGNQEITAAGYDYMVKSFESWAMFALPDTHDEHKRVKAMDAALQRFDNKEADRFAQYWGDGQTSLEELTIMRTNNPNFVDPIYAVWRWQPIAFEPTGASRGGPG